MRIVWMWLERAFLLGLFLQLLLIGFGVFPRKNDPSPFALHRTWGYILGDIAVVLFLLALAARPGWKTVVMAFVVGLLTFLVQPTLVEARKSAPVLAAFHPVDALVIFWLTLVLIRRSAASVTAAAPKEA
ncbi:MAG TPA: DUF6220 domain-containing protein [Actinomycetota bacterium]|nr:DUF6220 domain-containing protein [Actinomycetota bacterium]